MYEVISEWMVSKLEANNIIFQDRSIYKYGIELFVSTLVGTALVLLIGVIFNSLFEAVIYEMLFVVTRGSFGGYHCKTYLRCNGLFLSVFTISLFIQTNITINLFQ